ncbi:hypothetical protein [uncultured Pedobacter sp.]|uniref:hypothetical protein n=1 Tax=uncultured Pedobacter sp. TaxID=246139 RepID=UPI00263598B1|nr:hypothetical protein [uncultured Pedobacter sp.]
MLATAQQPTSPRSERKLYKKHIRYTQKEHNRLCKTLGKLEREEQKLFEGKDTSVTGFQKIREGYFSKLNKRYYLNKKDTSTDLLASYEFSMEHMQLIKQAHEKINRHQQKLIATNKDRKNPHLLNINKEAYYSKAQFNYNYKNELKDVYANARNKMLSALKQQQSKYLKIPELSKYSPSALKEETNSQVSAIKSEVKLPEGIQSNMQVQKSMPQNAPGVKPEVKSDLHSKMSKGIEQVGTPAFDSSMLKKDTVLFKPNPYKILPVRKRIKFGGDWQFTFADAHSPTILNMAPRVSYLLSRRIVPTAAFVYRLGLGRGLESFAFSNEGFGFRAGAEYLIIGNIAAFASYEVNYEQRSETRRKETTRTDGAVLGITNQSGKQKSFRIWFGLDLLKLYRDQGGNYLIMRFGL